MYLNRTAIWSKTIFCILAYLEKINENAYDKNNNTMLNALLVLNNCE